MYLHKDSQLFEDIIAAVSKKYSLEQAIVEKDYYVSMILKLLAEKSDKIVFKGGTSLSKCFHAINRFSEDIDITFSEHLGKARRKKLKYNIMKTISEELEMPVINWEQIESDKNLNQYMFQYKTITGQQNDDMLPVVKVETALGSYAFPMEYMEVASYIYRYLAEEEETELIEKYELMPFMMNVQALERTYIDKVFALCDYYLQGKSKRYSRHLYDLYKLQEKVAFNESFCELVKEVRKQRESMGAGVCPSAQQDVNVSEIIRSFCKDDFYKNDYETITEYFVQDRVSYEDVIQNILKIMQSKLF